MKLAHLIVLLAVLSSLHGQGTIRFTNLDTDAAVRNAAGELVPAGYAYTVELLAGPDPASLSPVSGTALFSSPGIFGGRESVRVLSGIPAGSHPWFQIACWRQQSEIINLPPPVSLEIGTSAVFQLDPTGPGLGETADDAPVLLGMTPFQLEQTFSLSVGMENSEVIVRWEAIAGGGGWLAPRLELERATAPRGPWQVLTNAVSPYSEPVNVNGAAYFRIMVR